jgi:uncharacterized iron-regulated membrane protein
VSTELALFLLRILSGALLLLMLAALFFVMWREYRATARETEARRRSYGRIVGLIEIDGMMAKTGESFPLLPITSLGRAPTNTIKIDDTFASGEHAVVALRNGQWWLEDRKSRNGTTLNGIPINQPVIVTDGDIIGVGSARYRLDMEEDRPRG